MELQILEKIGLTRGETRAYLALLKLGLSSTGPLEKQSQVSRSKLYSILDKLEKKGLASHVEKNGVVYFQAVEPEKITDYLTEKENELKRLEREFKRVLPELQAYYKSTGMTQKVRIYQGLKGLRVAHEHIYLKLKRGDEFYYLGIPAYQPEEHHRYWQKDHERRARTGIMSKSLFNQNTDRKILRNRNSYALSDARYMPTDMKTPAYFLIYKDTVSIAIASKDPIAIEIVGQEIADSFKSYFVEFWKKSKPFRW